MQPLKIDIWSDLACPWCWIGKQSLGEALAAFDGDVDIRWRAFELNPDAPKQAPESVDYATALASKYGTDRQEGQAFIDRMVAAGAARGIELRFDRIRPSSTFDAHRLLAWAYEKQRQTELSERLFCAYLNEGRSLSDHATLTDVATDSGLAWAEAESVLAGNAYANEVRADERAARQLGISGVPCFVMGESRLALSGAQPPEVLAEAMRQARAQVAKIGGSE